MEEEKSRSQKKREAEELQKLGVSLIEWSEEKLAQLPLPSPLHQAIMTAKSLKSHGAKRRQAQLIGKLMRNADLEAVYPIYQATLAEGNAQTAQFHDIENWRHRLISEGHSALTEFVDTFHPEDLQHLKQLIKKTVDAQSKEQEHTVSRALFRYIRSCIK